MPDHAARKIVAAQYGPTLAGADALDPDRREALIRAFADQTDGLSLSNTIAITQLARREGMRFDEIEDAVLRFKVGVSENPWRQSHLRQQVTEAADKVGARVKGQPAAVQKTLDILKRSIGGLSGAHTSRRSGRPRGVLFFAGPTGVGKTELAKAITEVLFNDQEAYVRFDMSEFSSEHSDARLLGAPPGYVGHDAGGQLTNAIRQRPFSVVLFDEIEKAHPRILDKFLQLLEDGRLTDGSGNTVYFSETVIIFTSNLGMSVKGKDGKAHSTVKPGATYDEVQQTVNAAIKDHFTTELGGRSC